MLYALVAFTCVRALSCSVDGMLSTALRARGSSTRAHDQQPTGFTLRLDFSAYHLSLLVDRHIWKAVKMVWPFWLKPSC